MLENIRVVYVRRVVFSPNSSFCGLAFSLHDGYSRFNLPLEVPLILHFLV